MGTERATTEGYAKRHKTASQTQPALASARGSDSMGWTCDLGRNALLAVARLDKAAEQPRAMPWALGPKLATPALVRDIEMSGGDASYWVEHGVRRGDNEERGRLYRVGEERSQGVGCLRGKSSRFTMGTLLRPPRASLRGAAASTTAVPTPITWHTLSLAAMFWV